MSSTQTYTFIKTKKDVSLDKEAFVSFIDPKNPELLRGELASLPEFNVHDHSVRVYTDVLMKAIRGQTDLKTKEKMFYLLTFLLNVQKNDAALMQEFLKQFKALKDSPLFKAKIATILFKSIDNKELKKELLLETIKLLSGETKVANLVSLLQTIDPILTELNLSDIELAEIYQLSIHSLQKIPLYKNLTIHLILKLLKLPTDKLNSAEVDRSLLFLIKNATVNEQILQLVQSSANKALNESLIFSLFKFCLAGDLEDYSQLKLKRLQQIQKLDIKLQQYERKLKTNSIANMASNNKTLTYDQISSKLQIPKEQVEHFVITAIQNSVISARINEVDEVVLVEDIKSKYFSPDEWESILEGVDTLSSKLQRYLNK